MAAIADTPASASSSSPASPSSLAVSGHIVPPRSRPLPRPKAFDGGGGCGYKAYTPKCKSTSTSTQVHVAALPVAAGDDVLEDEQEYSTQGLHFLHDEQEYSTQGLHALPIVISHAKGAYLWATDGRKYLDFMSAFAVANQGHCHPRIIAALVDQAQRCTLTSRAVYNDKNSVLCKKLCQLLGFEKASAMNTGSDAIDLVIKLARHWGYTRKGIAKDEAVVLTCTGNFHGKTLTPLAASTNEDIKAYFGPFLPGVGAECNGRTVRFNNVEDLRQVLESDGHRVAAFMVECVQGYGGCRPVSEGYLRAVRELCTKHNVLLVIDEIQSGFGRAGYFMSYQKENIQPDLLVLGKALTGGVYAMSMVLGSKEVMGDRLPGQHSSTFSGNPLACAVALEAINVVLDEKLPQRARDLGDRARARLQSIQSPFIAEVTGQGLMIAVSIDESHPSGRVKASRLAALMAQRGVILYSAAHRIRMSPPLVMEETDLWGGIDIFESCLRDLVNIDEKIPGE
ncbi:ornithine-oxo-acid transaminase [Capronia epimyces CBS 606.96]|uniref:ornithine aminotransferase n=1 Tax=Capronia epimyces CBS 606.96 TaxID=1182542 RepID=W9XJC7_9EURO|nr:ornithine-oxo-acid transaminase [Capronia epimyces CBS 606.96]EXJ77076.1 ornithine-oxo-acid transaminase [Capronia epimyces CBS 606.96]